MKEFKRILGIDYGSRRIGLSMSDPLCIIATPAGAIKNDEHAIREINGIVLQEGIGLIVIGMPLNLKGEKSHKAEEVEGFIRAMKEKIDVDVLTWDERFTSKMARHSLIAMGTKRKNRNAKSGTIDTMAAAIILQSFLDSTKRSRSC